MCGCFNGKRKSQKTPNSMSNKSTRLWQFNDFLLAFNANQSWLVSTNTLKTVQFVLKTAYIYPSVCLSLLFQVNVQHNSRALIFVILAAHRHLLRIIFKPFEHIFVLAGVFQTLVQIRCSSVYIVLNK